LKTQIHPRFLFQSLNSLEQKLKQKQSDSPEFILKLANILSYILYESESEYVFLAKEIEVISEYIELQRKNFPETLVSNLDVDIPAFSLYIAPLILLPFVEKSFEYLTIKDDSRKNIDIIILANGENLLFKLSCFEEYSTEHNLSQKQNWSEIAKRIESLYPNNHQLVLKSDSKGIQIELQLNMNGLPDSQNSTLWSPNLSYEYS
jgi:hypothetical protein